MNIKVKHTANRLLLLIGFIFLGTLFNPVLAIDSMDYGDALVPPGNQKVTFIELGANKCLPCRMMQPILQELEVRYPQDLKVIFIDVWKEDGEVAGKKYNLRAIPTQIFYNAQGEEIFRHEGFLPKNQIESLLSKHGVSQ